MRTFDHPYKISCKSLAVVCLLVIAFVLLFSQHVVGQQSDNQELKSPKVTNEFAPLEMGVNVNERPHWLKPELLQQSQTTWVRAFIEVSHYIKGNRSLSDDYRVDALHRVADNGYKILLSIKWNLKEAEWRVPEPGSEQEKKWFQFAGDLLNELDRELSILVLVNEITIDTPEEDLQPNKNGVIPFVRFQKRLLDYISKRNPQGVDGKPLDIYTGGFTRLDKENLQNHPANQAMFEWISDDERLSGADFHMHQADYKTSMEAADFIRTQIPEKPLIVTEFSFVWHWKAHLGDQIGSSEAGQHFAEQYGYDQKMTVAEYSTQAFSNPVTEKEWQDFMKSQSWFEPNYLDIMGRMMERHGVIVATYAFTQNPETDEPWNISESMDPWFIQQLFMPRVAKTESGKTAVNYALFKSFVQWQKVTDALKSAN